MKLAIFGNCQAPGVAACLAGIRPGLQADVFHMRSVRSPDDAVRIAERLSGYDVVLSQNCTGARYGPLRSAELKPRVRRLITFPKLIFTGFHPDIVLLTDRPAGRFHNNHSAIAAGAFLCGLPAQRVPALFNAFVFRRLGYFEEFERARAYLAELCAPCDLGGGLPARLETLGAFMHTPTHPVIEILWLIAGEIAGTLGVEVPAAAKAPADELAAVAHFPVYPEIARPLGLTGGRSFMLGGEAFDLPAMIEESYAAYRAQPGGLADVAAFAAAAEVIRAEVSA